MRALWRPFAHGGPKRTAFLLGRGCWPLPVLRRCTRIWGTFGRLAISRAWHCIVLPSLILNYLGLAAIAIRHPGASREGIFFQMVPQGIPTLLLVLLATLATIIASQALISGVFSLTAQARDLGLLSRFLVCHTSRAQRGQVYLPVINWHLAAACLLLVISFRSSGNLAAAYGLAVTATMVITSIAFGLVMVRVWRQPPWVRGECHGYSTVFGASVLFFVSASLWHAHCVSRLHAGLQSPKILIEASKRIGCAIQNNDTFFVLPREMIVEYAGTEMPIWQRTVFGALSRYMSYAPDYFLIPCTQIVDFTWMLKA